MRVLITGASRGIGAAVARAFARHGGSDTVITVTGRSHSHPSHPLLQGTLLDTVRAVESHGACGIPLEFDLKSAEQAVECAERAIDSMGGLDVLVNNASVLYLDRDLSPKQSELVHSVNARATLLLNQTCRASLEASKGSIVTLSPPVCTSVHDWIAKHPAYTISKYSMSLATLAMASPRVRANCLWPRHTVATSATKHLEMGLKLLDGAYTRGRSPDEVGEAVYALATQQRHRNARMLYDDEVLEMSACDAPLDLFAVEDTRGMCAF